MTNNQYTSDQSGYKIFVQFKVQHLTISRGILFSRRQHQISFRGMLWSVVTIRLHISTERQDLHAWMDNHQLA